MSNVKTLSDATYEREVEADGTPWIVDLWAPWCGPCRAIAPMIEDLAHQHAGDINVGKLNIDENPRTASRLAVRSIPTILLIRGGRVVDTVVGAVPAAVLARRVDEVLLQPVNQK